MVRSRKRDAYLVQHGSNTLQNPAGEGASASLGWEYFLSNDHLVPITSRLFYPICLKLDLCEVNELKGIEIGLWFTAQGELSVYNNSQWVHLSTKPIKSSGTVLNKLWHGVLINVSRWHKMSLLKSTGFSFLISNVGFGARDSGVWPLLTQDAMSFLWGLQLGKESFCTTRYKHIHKHTKQMTA